MTVYTFQPSQSFDIDSQLASKKDLPWKGILRGFSPI